MFTQVLVELKYFSENIEMVKNKKMWYLERRVRDKAW